MATTEQVATMIEIMQQQQQQVAQLVESQQLQQQPPQQPGGTANARGDQSKKPDRPTINANMNDREWALFLDTWSRYKEMIGVSPGRATDTGKIRNELRQCCSNEVNKMLFEFVGPTTLNNSEEATLLAHIKTISVKEVHPEVHQTSFNLMVQEPGESVTQWVARLKSMACLCKFEIETNCNCDPPRTISYADQMVAQRLIAGLANLDHRRKLLADASILTTLDAKVQRLQLLETTEESAAVLHRTVVPSRPAQGVQPSEASAARSQRKKQGGLKPAIKKSAHWENSTGDSGGQPSRCKGCGDAAHPGGRSKCHAFKKTCHSCGKKGHIADVCLSSPAAQGAYAVEPSDDESDGGDEIVQSQSSVSFSLGEQVRDDLSIIELSDFRPRRRRNEYR